MHQSLYLALALVVTLAGVHSDLGTACTCANHKYDHCDRCAANALAWYARAAMHDIDTETTKQSTH